MEKTVLGIAAQRKLVRDTNTVDSYSHFALRRFSDGREFVTGVTSYAEKYAHRHGVAIPADHVRFIALKNLLVAQYGWERLAGHEDLHRKRPKREREHPLMSLPYIAATTVFIAELNIQARPFKEELARHLDPDLADGLWGAPITAPKGKLAPGFVLGEKPTADVLESAQVRAYNRLHRNRRPIHRTDHKLNETIVETLGGFDGKAADAVTVEQFETDIFPEIKNAVNALGIPGDTQPIFTSV